MQNLDFLNVMLLFFEGPKLYITLNFLPVEVLEYLWSDYTGDDLENFLGRRLSRVDFFCG